MGQSLLGKITGGEWGALYSPGCVLESDRHLRRVLCRWSLCGKEKRLKTKLVVEWKGGGIVRLIELARLPG